MATEKSKEILQYREQGLGYKRIAALTGYSLNTGNIVHLRLGRFRSGDRGEDGLDDGDDLLPITRAGSPALALGILLLTQLANNQRDRCVPLVIAAVSFIRQAISYYQERYTCRASA